MSRRRRFASPWAPKLAIVAMLALVLTLFTLGACGRYGPPVRPPAPPPPPSTATTTTSPVPAPDPESEPERALESDAEAQPATDPAALEPAGPKGEDRSSFVPDDRGAPPHLIGAGSGVPS